jgi:hypothetical protein
VLAIATIGCAMSPAALGASFKCTTKAGVTYQDKPCAESPPETAAGPARETERTREASRQVRVQKVEAERARPPAEQRRGDDPVEQAEWVERSARKAESLRRCASASVKCSAGSLRDAALYLSEQQIESALGAPAERQMIGLERTTLWSVQVNDQGRIQNARLVAAWGLCSDEKHYFASGYGQRACKIIVE